MRSVPLAVWFILLLVLSACDTGPVLPHATTVSSSLDTPNSMFQAEKFSEDTATSDTVFTEQEECDETAIIPCEEPGGGGGWPFFNDGDSRLYEAPNDPSPGAPGVWLGTNVNPSACFTTGRGTVTSNDTDGDGLANHCELPIARSFAPMLHFANGDQCPGGEPYWSAKRFPNGVVRVAYMMAYYEDCGYDTRIQNSAHSGDSELVMVEMKYNSGTQHWEFNRMWLSAHYEATFWGTDQDYSEWVSAAQTDFYDRSLALPNIWVAEDKHANYRSIAKCEDTGAWEYRDDCGSLYLIRFLVEGSRNAGSRYVDLVDCVRSEERTSSTRTEGFYTDCHNSFRGWNEQHYGKAPAPYRYMLFSEFHFENYRSEDSSREYTSY